MLIKRKSIEKDASQRQSRKKPHPPVTLSEEDGIRYLHFGTRWIQGAMRIKRPDRIELEYVQQMMAWMLFIPKPQHVVQLGLGTAALTKFCYRHFTEAQVTAVELNPAVIAICETQFKLPPNDARLHVLEQDALDFVNDDTHHGQFDVLQADLYDEHAQGPVLDTPAFYRACAACLKPDGIMMTNLFGEHPSYHKNLHAMEEAFERVLCLPPVPAGNVVAMAFKRLPTLDFGVLYERAFEISKVTDLPARQWVNGLKLTHSG
ncbi:MAG: fused MFS/spermidine synthase [Erysipelotrichales bacterium]|nr:fused MFS/spermidine synthase [Erysipelotrichales bacterium]